ncbi:hypothetical protein EV715DRAFT_204441 [Schizophyllum commune]
MHAALQIPELLELIFSHISEKKLLNALARTCRAFLEPALGRLWGRIVTLEPFILLLSESKRHRDSETWITTLDDLASPDVARMRFYAPFVRDLDLRNSDSSFEIDGPSVAKVSRALSLARDSASRSSGDSSALCSPDDKSTDPRQHQQFIFPNLRAFTLVAGYADALPALLAPSVTELDLILHYRSMGVEELQRTMGILLDGVPSGRGCFPPSVKKLHVVLDYPENQNHLFCALLARRRDGDPSRLGGSTSSRLGDTTSSRLGDATSPRLGDTIQSLVIDFAHLDTATLRAIATLPNLEHLEVYNGYRAHSFELDEALDTSPATGTIAGTSPATKNIAPHQKNIAPHQRNIAPNQKKTAPRLRSLAVDILTPGVLAPYISGAVLRVFRPPALTHLTLGRILSPAHLRQACADIARSSAARTLTHLTLTGDQGVTTLSGDWSGTTISPADLRALHACRGLEELELVWLEIRFGVGDVGEEGVGDVRRVGAVRRMGEEGGVGLKEENMDTSLEAENMDTALEEEDMDTALEEEEIREMGEAWPRLRRFAVREVGRGEGDGRALELHASEGVGDADAVGVGDADAVGARNNGPRGVRNSGPRGTRNSGPRGARLAAFARYFPNLEELEI